MICESITADKIKNIPNILISFKNWSSINHANIAAKTPSSENIIAAGAGDIFCKLYVCNKKNTLVQKKKSVAHTTSTTTIYLGAEE